MAGTTTKGFRYPTAGDNPAIHTDFLNLATDVDTYLDAPQVTTSIIFEGATANAFETTLTVVDPTSDRTITLPNLSGTVMINSDFTAKGHLLVGTGTGTFVSLAPGNAGQSLIIDSGEASGMRWATSSSGGAAFSEFMLAGA